jgi:phage terminase Nu1 subunit (DNA packaging protein)
MLFMGKIPGVVSGPQLAGLLGLSAKSVATHANTGVIVRVGRGKYRLRESVRSYTAHLRQIAAGRDDPEAATARNRILEAKARIVEAKLAVLEGKLVPAPRSKVRGVREGLTR